MQTDPTIADLRKKRETARKRLADTEDQQAKLSDGVMNGEPAAMAAHVILTTVADEIRAEIEAVDQTLGAKARRRPEQEHR